MKHRAILACMTGAVIVCSLQRAAAQGQDSRVSDGNQFKNESDFAVIVQVTDREIVFDRGTRGGVKTGDRVRLYRTLTVHHPISGDEITDQFPIGNVRVAEASELLSIIKNSKQLAHSPKVGDLVQIIAPKKKSKPTSETPTKPIVKAKPPATAAVQQTPASKEKRDLGKIFVKSLGRPIAERILFYSRFLSMHPKGTYADAVTREIDWLEDLEDQLSAPSTTSDQGLVGVGEPALRPTILHPGLGPLEVGDAAQVVIATIPPNRVVSARLFLRLSTEDGYDEVAMERDGSYYYRAHIPDRYVSDTGTLVYFIEVASPDGTVHSVVGSAQKPRQVTITRPIVDRIMRKGRSTTRALFEYVNFDMDDKIDDEYWSFEADFFYRIYTFLYGVRVGMGIFSGTGGKLEAIEESRVYNQELAAHYGFIEGEFEIVPLFHFMVRGLAGNQRSPGEETSKMSGVFGLEGGIRIGEETKTNLALSGAIVTDVGYEARIGLEINVVKKVPITVEGLVTNFPVEESHLGLRLVLGTGYRFTDWLAIFARGSWNARTIRHTGFGGGAGMALSW